MRRAALTFIATVVGLVLLLGYKTHGAHALFRPSALAPATPGSGGATGAGGAAPSASPSAPPASGGGASRTITGQAVDTPYGPVQVQIKVSGRRITSVQPVQLPQSFARDIEIDNYAVPQLIQETMAAQTSNIDAVSGATFTSEGYIQSLQSALDQLG